MNLCLLFVYMHTCTHTHTHTLIVWSPQSWMLQNIKDWHLALLVTFLVTVDVIILVVASVVSSAQLRATLVPHEENMFDVDEVN